MGRSGTIYQERSDEGRTTIKKDATQNEQKSRMLKGWKWTRQTQPRREDKHKTVRSAAVMTRYLSCSSLPTINPGCGAPNLIESLEYLVGERLILKVHCALRPPGTVNTACLTLAR